MPLELIVPSVGESITEVEIGGWLKAKGERVRKDEPVVTLESEKATIELPAPASGVLLHILKEKGAVAKVGEVIAYLETGATPTADPVATTPAPASAKLTEALPTAPATTAVRIMPAAEQELARQNLKPEQVQASGPGGRLLKEDVLRHVEQAAAQSPTPAPAPAAVPASSPAPTAVPAPSSLPVHTQAAPTPDLEKAVSRPGREEEIVPMSRLRRTVAERLVEAQHTAALLTTFNEIDLSGVMTLRKDYGEAFHQKYNVKLGFMSFFVKACIDGLKQYPNLNAEVRGNNIVYHNFYDIGVAVGSGKGLVVPVLRNAEHLSFAQVELAISDFGRRARENKLKVEELQGGTFTISNGGVYGSLLSTPIVNPPQSGVLGMHAIQERPVAREGQVVIRPMMYVALSYDHRIVDGREAVSFLKRVKDVLEAPARMLMEV